MDIIDNDEHVGETAPLLASTARDERHRPSQSRADLSGNVFMDHKDESGSAWRLPFKTMSDVFPKMTWNLFAVWMLTSVLNIMFGYASTNFSGLQNIPSFSRQFGTPSGPDGTYALSASRVSFMSSIGFSGKLLGTLTAPLPLERAGHKSTILMACLISFIGIAIQCSSKSVAQFVSGRVLIYYSVGVIEVATPMYQAEIAPASMRGTVVGSVQFFNQIGQILSACINRLFYRSLAKRIWIIPVVVQTIFPLVVTMGLMFIPAAPRWLIQKHRKEDAIHSLEFLRPSADAEAGHCQAEADAIEEALKDHNEKAPWTSLFLGTNLRRTSIAVCVLSLQQLTGQAFVSQYSPRFYETVGLGDQGFNYNIATAVAGWISCTIGMIISDIVGRRDLLIWGGLTQAVFLFLMATFGAHSHPSSLQAHGLVFSVILYIFVFTGSWAPVSYALASEVGSASLREKTMGLGVAVNVLSGFAVTFSLPFLLESIGASIGWLFGIIAIGAAIYAFFCIPETKYRSLEEMDELFEAKIPAREFKYARTTGAARRVAELENQNLPCPTDVP